MDKKTFYIVGGVMVFALLILVVLATVLNTKKGQPMVGDSNITVQDKTTGQDNFSDEQSGDPTTVSPTSAVSTTEQVVESFYSWYINHKNPLGSGEFINYPNLSEHFKEIIVGFVNRGDHLDSDPILTCVGIKAPKNIVVQPAVYDNARLNASVVVQEGVAGGRLLYEFILKNINDKWVIEDVRCNL